MGRAAYCLSFEIARYSPTDIETVHVILGVAQAGYELYISSLQETDLPMVWLE